MDFPLKPWKEMNKDEQKQFREMSEECVVRRWNSKQGEEIKRKIVEINLEYGTSSRYRNFLGTVKIDVGNKPPKIDLRGIDFSGFSNLIENEIFGFDFSDCSLTYSNFSDAEFTSSKFRNADILYSNFSNSILEGCDFFGTNLTLSDFSNSRLEGADFGSAWISDVSFHGSDLGYIKYNRQTDFHNIDATKVSGSSNPFFLSFIRRKHYLKHFKEHNFGNKIIYYIWLAISDCGQSFLRWSCVSMLICLMFGVIYSRFPESFFIANNRKATAFTFYYYSVVTFTTLGFGDVVPKDLWAEIAITTEVITGYIMLGGLISIFATKFIPKD
jgi:uncharacterized protein YjbI with pentapeptide repeats